MASTSGVGPSVSFAGSVTLELPGGTPDPSIASLLGVGLVALALRRRR